MKYKLDDIANFGNGKKKPNKDGKIPIYGGNGILGFTDIHNANNAIIIGRVGAYCGSLFYEKGKCWVSDNAIWCKNKEKIDIVYLYYLLKTLNLNARHIGTGQPLLTQDILKRIECNVVELKCQKFIAKILTDIDAKIELNNKINDNLYEQMYSIYKSWFELYEQNNGVKPDSWIRVSIYEITNVIYGAPFSSKLFNEEKNGRPIIRIRDLKSQNFNTYTPEIHPKGYLLQKGDIVVGMDGEFRPYIWGNEEAWLNQRVCVFDNKRPRGKAFLFFTIKPLLKFIEDTEAATTVIHIGKNDFDKFNFIMPDEKTMNEYDEITFPMYDQILNNMLENIRLIKLRDSLLPKLMSGEIDVSNIKLDL